jgi:hypothetical protein
MGIMTDKPYVCYICGIVIKDGIYCDKCKDSDMKSGKIIETVE